MQTSTTANIACNLCNNDQVSVLATRSRSGQPLRTVCCTRCGLVWSDPRPHDPRRFYEEEYRLAYKRAFEPKPKHILRAGRVALSRVEKIRALLNRPLQVLDVGSGGGEFAYLLKRLGHDVLGVEPNKGYASYAMREYGLQTERDFIGDAALPERAFDLVTIWHVLEHTEDPCRVLQRLARALRPDGVLVVEVPNVEAICQSPRSSFHEAHLYTFNPATLETLGARAGLGLRALRLSEDGGNITATFVLRAGTVPAADVALSDNHDRICAIVRRHTPLRHLLTAHPYRRLLQRFARALDERLTLRAEDAGRPLLDRLYAHCAGQFAPPAATPLIAAPRFWPTAIASLVLAVGIEETLVDGATAAALISAPSALTLYLLLQSAVIAGLVARVRKRSGRASDYAKVAGVSVPLFLVPVYC